MLDARVASAFRAVRLRRGWRQEDVADRAGVSRAFVSLVERGHLAAVSLGTLRRVAAALDIRLDVVPRWRGGELDRLLNAGHAALHGSVLRHLGALPGWLVAPEVSYSVYGERGVIDILAWHEPSGSLLVIEIKTAIVDVSDLIGGVDRKRRLGPEVARDRGWQADTVSGWVIVGQGRTNERRVAEQRALLRTAFPQDGRAMSAWLRDPAGAVSALSIWPYAIPGGASSRGRHRVSRAAPMARAPRA